MMLRKNAAMGRYVWIAIAIFGVNAFGGTETVEATSRKDLAQQYLRSLYGGDLSKVDHLVADDIVISYPVFETLFHQPALHGRQAVKDFAQHFAKKWVDGHLTIHETIVEGNRVVLIWGFRARDAESGEPGQPSSTQEQHWGGITFIRFNDDGKIVAEIGEESVPGPMARIGGHLPEDDSTKTPRFHWREETPASRPRIKIETDLGDIEAELFEQKAPITVANFLRYVETGYFTNGRFFRTVTLANQPHDKVKIQVIQAEANPEKASALFAPIVLERTRDTGIHHLDGTLSMARSDPNSAQDSFSICVGDQPELDFGGHRQPDGQGFAAFGRVTRGMDIVRKIHDQPCTGQQLMPAIRIKAIVRLP